MTVPSKEALRVILKTIANGELKDGSSVEWMSLWDVRIKSRYSQEYTRATIRSLYWEHHALVRMQEQGGPKFLYQVSAKGEDLLEQWMPVDRWKKKEGR